MLPIYRADPAQCCRHCTVSWASFNFLSSPWKRSLRNPAHSSCCFLPAKETRKEGRYRQGVLNQSLLHFWGNLSSFIITVMLSISLLYPLRGPSVSHVHFSSTLYRWGNWGPPSWRQSWDHTRFPDHWDSMHSTKSFLFQSNGSKVAHWIWILAKKGINIDHFSQVTEDKEMDYSQNGIWQY